MNNIKENMKINKIIANTFTKKEILYKKKTEKTKKVCAKSFSVKR